MVILIGDREEKTLLKMINFSAPMTVIIGEKREEEIDDDGGDEVTGRREEEFLVMRVMISGNDLRKRKKNSI